MTGGVIPLDQLDDFLEDRMRVYLAGPLTANDPGEAELCRRIRLRAMRVLRSRFQVYDPAEITPPGTDHTADQVFNEDHTRTSTADLVFFHVNVPSLGVGIESQIAAEATIPRVIAVPKGTKVSRMFDGVFNPTIARIEYTDEADFEQQLVALLPMLIAAVRRSAEKRRPELDSIRNAQIGRAIFGARILLKRTIEELAATTDIRACMLQRLERDDAVAGTLTLVQLKRIAAELGATLAISGRLVPCLRGPGDEAPEVNTNSLNTLYDFLQNFGDTWVPDEVVFRMWDYAFPLGTGTASAARGDDPAVRKASLSTAEWEEVYLATKKSSEDRTLFDGH
jgi:hypothetical protein